MELGLNSECLNFKIVLLFLYFSEVIYINLVFINLTSLKSSLGLHKPTIC